MKNIVFQVGVGRILVNFGHWETVGDSLESHDDVVFVPEDEYGCIEAVLGIGDEADRVVSWEITAEPISSANREWLEENKLELVAAYMKM